MATQLRIKRGTADAAAPTGLTAGEMAINLVDKKLYIGGTAGTNVIFLDSTAVAGLGTANTFTQLNTFSAGISASGATFSKDITVNSTMTVGFGGSGLYSNVAFGSGALSDNTIGESNVGIGAGALGNNTEGSENIAIGGNSLFSNTTGSRNIAIGSAAVYWSTSSDDNIAIGANVMGSAPGYVPGSYNVGIGTDALKSGGFTGESNVAIGYAAAAEDTTGSHNVAIGFESLRNNSTGLYNTSVGSGALRHGNSITVQIGGSQMTALGYGAGRYRGTATSALTTGTGGIFIGYQARGSANAQTNEIVIGVDAIGLGSNTAVIGATLQSAATIYGLLNLPSGLSAAGATFTGNISAPNIVNSVNGLTGSVKIPRSLSVYAPTTSDSITLFYTPVALTISRISAVLRGSSTPSVTYNLNYGTSRSSGTLVFTSGTTVTSTTTATVVTSFNNSSIPAGGFLWLTASAVSGTVDELSVSVEF